MELNYVPHFPAAKDISILDIGCGRGEALKDLRRLGYQNVRGIDIDPEKIAACKAAGLNVELIDDLKKYLRGRTFDVIMLKTVIAHFPKEEVIPNLISIYQALGREGILIAETTNAAILTGYYMLANDFTHWQYFTEYSFRQILLRAGFSSVKVSGKKAKVRSVKFFIWTILRFFWFLTLRVIYWIERGNDENPTIFSKSLIAICRKSS
jgi:SAM-dependent methyltransferase